MIEGDAFEFHFEQLVHRQGAARVGQAHDHTIDALPTDDAGNIVDGSDNAWIEQGRPDPRRIGIDEPDDFDAQLVPVIVQLRGESDGRAAGPDEQQPLARTDAAAQPFEHHAPDDDNREQQDRGDEKHAPPEDEAGKPEVQHRQREARRGQRLHQPRVEFAAIRRDACVIEVGVIQADLGDAHDDQDPDDPVLVSEELERFAGAKAQVGRRDHGRDHQDRLESRERDRPDADAMDQEPDHRRLMSVPPRSL